MKNGLIQSLRNSWSKSRLSWRLLLGVLLFSSVITLLGTGLQLYLDYQRDLGDLDDHIESVRVSHLESLTTSLWKLDDQQLATEMDNVTKLRDIAAVIIHADGEIAYQAGQEVTHGEGFTAQRFPMIYDDGRNRADLGELEIIASLSGVQQRLIDRTLVILGTQSLNIFLVSAFILLFVQALISRHLLQIAEKAAQIHQGNADEFLSLNRGENKTPDELDIVVSALNEMILNSREWHAELEKTVQERTASLRASETLRTRFGRIIEGSLNEIFIFDSKTLLFTQVNHGAQVNLGYTMDELRSLTPIDIKPAITSEGFEKLVSPLRSGDEDLIVFETIHQRKDGTLYDVEVHIQLMQQEAPPVFVAIIQDITKRKKSEISLAERTEALVRSNADLQQFAYVSSHDLREPLRMVSSYLQLLERKYDHIFNDEAHEFIDYAVAGAKRMDLLIKDLLQYSRVETEGQEFEVVDSGMVLQEALDNLKTAIDDVSGVVAFGDLPMVQADRSQLTRLFQNLVGNALKYCPDNRKPNIHIAAETTETTITFSVQDNGIGVDPEFFDRIFVIFQRLHGREEYSGTGIGLAVCKRIIERHGGRIWVESEPGEGSTFFFTLPLA